MKTVSTKLLSLLLVAILLVSAIPFQAFAEGDGVVTPEVDDTPVVTPEEEKSEGEVINEISALSDDSGSSDDSKIQHDDSHIQNSPWVPDGVNGHYKVCEVENCLLKGERFSYAAHKWNENGVCDQCGFQCIEHFYNGDDVCDYCKMKCPTHVLVEVDGTYKAPTCTEKGKNADKKCNTCGMYVIGADIDATGHKFEGTVCSKCKATARSITLNPYPGTINNGASSTSYALVDDLYLINLPKPDDRTDYTFVGWMTDNGKTIYPNSTANITYDDAMGKEFTAQWVAKTKQVNVFAVLNGDYTKPLSGYVWQGEAPENGNLLDYLKQNAVSSVNVSLSNNPGYSWDGIFRDKQGNALADGTVNQAQNVYVNFTSIGYKLYFNADGGTVAPTEKIVYKGSKVGTLPTPYKEGKVFKGWTDDNGKAYTEETVYEVAGNTMLNAVWMDEAKVWLAVHINGNFSSADRWVPLDSFVVGDHIYWATVDSYLRKYYSAAPGSVMVVNGLFDKDTWASYRANPSQDRKNDILVAANTGTEIYVMINGVNAGVTILPTTPTTPTTGYYVRYPDGTLTYYSAGTPLPSTVASSGYWVLDSNGNPYIWVVTGYSSIIPSYIYTYFGTNPKTGDTAKIEIAVVVLVVAAVALIAVMILRKKKKSE